MRKETLRSTLRLVSGTLRRYGKSLLTLISPELNTHILYWYLFKKPLNLKNPVTLSEKILWLKLYAYRNNPLVTKCADKYAVRDYVAACGCSELLNELYGVYEHASCIKWDELPNKFVLKWNFGCGLNIFCNDKEKFDIPLTVRRLNTWGRMNMHLPNAELHYKKIPRKIICEKYIEGDNNNAPDDYKFYCFNGEAKYVMVCVGRDKGKPKFYFFDKDWNHQPLSRDSKAVTAKFSVPKPACIDDMFHYASILSKPFPFVRVDFYQSHGRPIFGEITFTPAGGFDFNRLPETELLFGSLVTLPGK